MQFDDVQFPSDINLDSSVALDFNNTIIEASDGWEQRVVRWAESRREFSVQKKDISTQDMNDLARFYIGRFGPYAAFRYKDWSDYTTAEDGVSDHTELDVEVELVPGETDVYQMSKVYTDGTYTYRRTLTCLVDLKVAVDGTLATPSSVDMTKGQFTIAGTNITAGCTFDVPVKFKKEMNELTGSIETYNTVNSTIELIEIKAAEFLSTASTTVADSEDPPNPVIRGELPEGGNTPVDHTKDPPDPPPDPDGPIVCYARYTVDINCGDGTASNMRCSATECAVDGSKPEGWAFNGTDQTASIWVKVSDEPCYEACEPPPSEDWPEFPGSEDIAAWCGDPCPSPSCLKVTWPDFTFNDHTYHAAGGTANVPLIDYNTGGACPIWSYQYTVPGAVSIDGASETVDLVIDIFITKCETEPTCYSQLFLSAFSSLSGQDATNEKLGSVLGDWLDDVESFTFATVELCS